GKVSVRGFRATVREKMRPDSQAWLNNSINADDTASGFSRGRKCPAPATIRRLTSFGNCTLSALSSVDGRARASSAPYKRIVGTSIFGRAASLCSTASKRGSPGAFRLRWRYEWMTQSTKSGLSKDGAVASYVASENFHVGDHCCQSNLQSSLRF